MTTPDSSFVTRLVEPRFGLIHLVLYTVFIVFACAVATMILIVQNVPTQMLGDIEEFVAPSPIPQVMAVPDADEPVEGIYRQDYDFTENYFSLRVNAWKALLEPYRGKPDIQYLEIGLFEGSSAMWMLENILTHPTARMTGLDIFEGETRARYFANLELSGAADKVTTIVDYSQLTLRKLPLDSFDIIYIDGSHDEDDVLEDAVLSWRLLKDGGLLIFDDYRLVKVPTPGNVISPKVAIDGFYQAFKENLEVLHCSRQLFVRKRLPQH